MADLERRWRPSGYDVLLGLLALVTLVLAVKALGPTSPRASLAADQRGSGVTPTTSPTPATSLPVVSPSATATAPVAGDLGLVAMYGAAGLQWSGAAACDAGVTTRVARSDDGGVTWTAVAVPLSSVRAVGLGPGGAGVVRGVSPACQPASFRTEDGGRTWTALPVDGSAGGSLWRRTGAGRVLHATAAGAPFVAVVADPCAEVGPGTAALVAEAGRDEAWALCQKTDGSGRLLVRTQDAGKTWRRLAGRRADTGLAGPGTVAALRFAGRTYGVAVVAGGACASGEVRRTVDGGLHWTALGCVPGVTRVLDAAFGDARVGLVAAASSQGVVTLRTCNGGRTWARTA